jgi:hypothetical protein
VNSIPPPAPPPVLPPRRSVVVCMVTRPVAEGIHGDEGTRGRGREDKGVRGECGFEWEAVDGQRG